ncbi:MAG: S26 family signal peptidase [Halobacteriales archaeon]|nr:S26 family signal peptidase [Halobacteriales archaeon]
MGNRDGKGERKRDGTDVRSKVNEFRDNPVVRLAEDVLVSVAIVGGIAVLLYAIAGIWPPMVAIESGSMEPGMSEGDIVFIVSPSNFVAEGATKQHGVVTHRQGKEDGYETFGEHGDVIVYRPDGSELRTAIIHRAMFYVEEGEEYQTVSGETLVAPHDGFVTKGDANTYYDQEQGLSEVVKPEWVQGKARYRVPYVGNIRLLFPSMSYYQNEVGT